MKKLLIAFVILLILVGLGVCGAYLWYQKQLETKASDSSSIVEIDIEQGESIKSIAVKLQTAGVIHNSDVFYFYIKLNDLAPNIQAGKFKIPQNLTIPDVVEYLQVASGNDIWITIPEGLRIDEIAQTLDEYFLKEENTNFDKDEFVKIAENPSEHELESDILQYLKEGESLEGFLFPDTYNIKKDIETKELVELLLDTLKTKLEEENISLDDHKDFTGYEVITLASIIEREARDDEQKYMVSDIFQKRLRGEMDGVKLLQADATLLYELKDWKAVVTIQLKEKDSPYNTYKNTGLTPTPICNPGIKAIMAVINPQENKYFYYLHDEEGNIHYAKTFEEHENNRRCYIGKNPDYCK